MIRSRKTTRKQPRVRTIYDIVAFPLTDQEEHQADEHIRLACDEIQATWSERERDSRRVPPREEWRPMVLTEWGRM